MATNVDYTPDATVALDIEGKTVIVHLSGGGEKFPWAVHKGRVIIGPPRGSTSDGIPLKTLEWNADDFWVIDAFDDQGESVTLDPLNYSRAVKAAARGEGQ